MKKDTLYLFTQQYPCGTGESFIETELDYHLKHFKKVVIFPLIKKGNLRSINENIDVVNLSVNIKIFPIKILIRYFFTFFRLFFKEFYKSKSKIAFLKQISFLKSSLLQNLKRAELLKNYLDKEKDVKTILFYSFWTDEWATVLSILKKQNEITEFISRVHGYDLYAERWPDSIIPFRNLQMESVSKIFTVSKDGLIYLQKNYLGYKNKFHLNHLCISDNGVGPFCCEQVFTIVSCSNLIPLKRVNLIAELLCKTDFPIKWVHFGNGAEKDNILEIVKKMPSKISVELKGHVANADIIKFYQTNSVNVFIHLSQTEGGVTLAIQEAASFGIPLIGTETGGIPEIVNETTGILIPVDFDIIKVSEIINTFPESKYNTLEFRKGVREFWKENFDAEKNYVDFYRKITQGI